MDLPPGEMGSPATLYPVKYQFKISPGLECGQHRARLKTFQFVHINEDISKIRKQTHQNDCCFWL